MQVYTDGSCVDDCASGIGIYFGPNHPLNKSKTIHGCEHNSGLAEIIAAKTALKSLHSWKLYRLSLICNRFEVQPENKVVPRQYWLLGNTKLNISPHITFTFVCNSSESNFCNCRHLLTSRLIIFFSEDCLNNKLKAFQTLAC